MPTDVAHRLGGADGVERSIGDQDLLALGGPAITSPVGSMM
jgi:hypothetical protein